LARFGERDAALARFDALVATGNDLGLLGSCAGGDVHAWPFVPAHVALVNAAHAL
jgi:hypothetical protein